MQVYYVYILRNDSNKLYIGLSKNVVSRLEQHNKGQAAKFTKRHKHFKIVYQEAFGNYGLAVKRERQLKGWTRIKKEALIAGDLELLKTL